MEISMLGVSFEWYSVIIRTLLALVLGGIIGMERGRQGRAAGMRTHILVSVGSAMTAMIGLFCSETLALGTDPLRICAQVISGIGFIGVGTILLKGRFQITGLTTAAGLWATAAIGIAVGIGFYLGAVCALAATVFTITLCSRLEGKLNRHHKRFGIYVEITTPDKVNATLELMRTEYSATDVQITAPRSNITGYVGIEMNIPDHKGQHTPRAIEQRLLSIEWIAFALESI